MEYGDKDADKHACSENEDSRVDLFLLTKPPGHPRTDLCLQLMTRAKNPRLYLAGDGVYNLLSLPGHLSQRQRVVACQEDVLARGLGRGQGTTDGEDFYRELVDAMLGDQVKMFVF